MKRWSAVGIAFASGRISSLFFSNLASGPPARTEGRVGVMLFRRQRTSTNNFTTSTEPVTLPIGGFEDGGRRGRQGVTAFWSPRAAL